MTARSGEEATAWECGVGGSRLYRSLGYGTWVLSIGNIHRKLRLMYSVMVNNAK